VRILHVNKFLYRRGGAEAYMEDAAQLMAADGHDVEFFGMAHPENTHTTFARHFPTEVELGTPTGGALAKAGVAARMVWSRSAERGLDAVLEQFRPDVVHFHNIYHQLSPSVLQPVRRRGIGAVLTLHDYKLACPSYQFLDRGTVCEACLDGRFRHAVQRRCKDGSLGMSTLLAVETSLHRRFRAYGSVSLFLCPSQFLHSKMTAAGVYPDRLRHLPNFVVTDAPDGAAGGDVSGPVVIASRLSHEKGIDTLVRAAGLLPPQRDVVIAGDGPQRGELEALAARVAPDRVRFAGRLDKAATMALVRGAAVVACPSRWYENQPMAVIEAMAAGVPVVGSALGGIPELIENGVTGATVRPDDPTALAAAISDVIGDADRWRRMSEAARRRYEQDFTPDVHRERLTGAYLEASPSLRTAGARA
jgi:glycosyltransferase involved in cell wall biosynthesis